MSAQRGSSSTHTTQQHADDAEESPADSGDDVQGLPSTGVAMQRTVGGGDGVTVRVQTSDDGNSVLSSAVFSRGNGDVDIDYFLAAVSLDAPFIWGGLTCALCARGRAITDTTLSGEVTEIVQHSGVYIHVSAKRGVVQRLQQLGVPVRPAKSANSLVVAEVVVAADTLRAALASAGVDYVLIEEARWTFLHGLQRCCRTWWRTPCWWLMWVATTADDALTLSGWAMCYFHRAALAVQKGRALAEKRLQRRGWCLQSTAEMTCLYGAQIRTSRCSE
jgi:hypothetical protein